MYPDGVFLLPPSVLVEEPVKGRGEQPTPSAGYVRARHDRKAKTHGGLRALMRSLLPPWQLSGTVRFGPRRGPDEAEGEAADPDPLPTGRPTVVWLSGFRILPSSLLFYNPPDAGGLHCVLQ